MIQKQTWVNICDSSSALWVKVFQLYGGFFRKTTSVGFFIKGSVRVYKPQVIFYKGYTKKKVKKGLIRRSILVRQTYNLKNNLFFFNFSKNTSIFIKKKNVVTSKYIFGPSTRLLKKKNLIQLFKYVY